jgi:cytochrome oxidase Cu insertion factor (SCO1/SenC/PrrC family)
MTSHRLSALACALSVLSCGGTVQAGVPEPDMVMHGDPPLPGLGGPLDLTDHTGQAFSLERNKGKPVLLFFGFTQCSNTCPVALLQAKQLLESFRSRRPPAVVFVTLDPLTDSPAVLASHLAQVDTRIIGLTGSPKQIEHVARRYGVATQSSASTQTQSQPSKMASTTAHSSRWYLLDSDHKLTRVYKITTPVADIVHDLMLMPHPRHEPIWSPVKP